MALFVEIVPSDTTVFDPPLIWIYVGGEGDVAVLGVGDTVAVTLKAVPQGTQLKFVKYGVSKVMATGTAATELVAMAER